MNRILPHLDLLQQYYRSRDIPYGSQNDLLRFADTLGESPLVQDEVASILRSVLYGEDLKLDRTDLLDLLCSSLTGEASGAAMAPSRDLILFVNRTVRSVQTGTLEAVAPPSATEAIASPGNHEVHAAAAYPPTTGSAAVVTDPWSDDPDLPRPVRQTFEPGDEVVFTPEEPSAANITIPPRAEGEPLPEPESQRRADLPIRKENSAPQAPHPHWMRNALPHALSRPAILCTCTALLGFGLGTLLPRKSPSAAAAEHAPKHSSTMPEASVAPGPTTSPVQQATAAPSCLLLPGGMQEPPKPSASITASGVPVFPISTSTACRLLLAAPPPVYPTLAALTQVRGVVSLELIISPQGDVTASQVLSGPALLRGAAEDAIRHWRFRPYVQDGRAVEVGTLAYIAFTPPPADGNS